MEYFTFFKLRESMKPHEYFTRKHTPVQTPRVQVLSGHMRLVAWSWRSSPIRWLWARGDITRGRHVLGLTPGCRARWDTQARTRYSAHASGLCEDPGPKAHARQAQAPRHFSRPLPHRPPSTRRQRRRAPTPPSPAPRRQPFSARTGTPILPAPHPLPAVAPAAIPTPKRRRSRPRARDPAREAGSLGTLQTLRERLGCPPRAPRAAHPGRNLAPRPGSPSRCRSPLAPPRRPRAPPADVTERGRGIRYKRRGRRGGGRFLRPCPPPCAAHSLA